MPRNGSGVYSLPAGTIVANGQALDESQHNPAMLDIAAEFNAARPIVAGGTGATSASGARTALGLAIGSDVQAHDATLTSLAALGTAADKFAYTTGVDTWAEAAITAQGRALLDDADATAQRATLGLGAAATAGFLDEDNFASDSATAAPSQQSTKAYVDAALSHTLGVGQTWQDLTASRAVNTSYQNTTGKPIEVKISTSGTSGNNYLYVSVDGAAWLIVSGSGSASALISTNGAVVPNNHYYKYTGAIDRWMELR